MDKNLSVIRNKTIHDFKIVTFYYNQKIKWILILKSTYLNKNLRYNWFKILCLSNQKVRFISYLIQETTFISVENG